MHELLSIENDLMGIKNPKLKRTNLDCANALAVEVEAEAVAKGLIEWLQD